MSRREDFHPSHDLVEDYQTGQDPHSPVWVCRVCRETACALCDPDDSDGELLEHCAGFPWTQGVTVAVGEDVTIRARKSGTGWV